ncbi:hypothetical protein LBC_11610 [Campylobacter sp. 19-13652]|nr:nicotinate (nicotinamide) nucleotide adenylyltransferase [Campylobacter sp. 19-13652]BCX79699.1 hypothetical protein LBC_11610 [Campylobacter sp. 19-13652]
MKIALYGGSFDPPHEGHDAVVRLALRELEIDKLIIMPTFISPFKSTFSAPPALRLEWIKKLWQGLDDRVEISSWEIKQSRPVPTVRTAEYLLRLYGVDKIDLVLGADHLKSLHKWHEFEKLKSMVRFVIAARDGIAIPPELASLDVHVDISSSQIRHHEGLNKIPQSIKSEVIKFYEGDNKFMNIKQRVAKIVSILDEKKAEAIEVFEMDEEYFVREVIIATTMGERHALSLTDELKNRLKPEGEQFLAVESSDEWVVIDLGDILIHLLSQSKRAVYNLEELLNSLKKRTN